MVRAGILKGPCHRFIFLRAFRAARIKKKAFAMLLKSNTAAHRCAIGMHVKDRKKNADALAARFQKFCFVDFLNIGDCAVCRRNHSALIGGIWPVWIAKKSDRVKNQRDKQKREPP